MKLALWKSFKLAMMYERRSCSASETNRQKLTA